jgi:hypothetical protein
MLNNIAILKSSLKYKDGINFLKNELGKERILCNKTIKEALVNFKSSQAVKFISRLLCKFYAKSKSDFCISLPIIQEQINDKLEMIFNLLGSRDISNIHKARIIIKKIRYILEIFPKKTFISLKSHISKIKKLQTILGDINDIDLFMKYLNKLTNQKNNILDLSSKTSIDYILKTLNKTKSNKLNSLDKYLQFLSNIDFQNKITNYIKQLDRSVAQ